MPTEEQRNSDWAFNLAATTALMEWQAAHWELPVPEKAAFLSGYLAASETIPVQDAKPTIVDATHGSGDVGRAGSANLPTGAKNTDWRCAGCGITSPDRLRSCDCPTNVVFKEGVKGTRWKRDTEEESAISKAIGLLLAHGYAITPPPE